MSTSDHPENDGPTERVNRVLEEILRGYIQSFTDWNEFVPVVEFAINKSVHASTTHTPFLVNGLRHPRLPTHLECDTNSRGGRNSLEQKPFWLLLITCRGNRRRERVDIGEDNLINSDDTIADPDEDDDAGIFSIANDYNSEEKNTLDEEEDDLLAVRTRRTATNQS